MKEKTRELRGYTYEVSQIIIKDGEIWLKWRWLKLARDLFPPPIEYIGRIPFEEVKKAFPHAQIIHWEKQQLLREEKIAIEQSIIFMEFLRNPILKKTP